MRSGVLLILFLIAWRSGLAQRLSLEEREILRLQDQRHLEDGRLFDYLNHTDATLRKRAAIALANIQDTSALSPLLQSLTDPVPSVRAAVAFAIGQIGSPRGEESLLNRLTVEADVAVLAQIAQALGRCGTSKGLDALLEFDYAPETLHAKTDIVLGIGRYAIRGIRTERSVWHCFDLLSDFDPEVRWRALFALWRAGPHRSVDIEIAKRHDDLKRLINDPNVDVRTHLASLLGRVRLTESAELLRELDSAERVRGEWRVQVAIVRSIGMLLPGSPQLLPHLLHHVESPNDHVAVAALQVLAGISPSLIEQSTAAEAFESTLRRIAQAGQRPDIVRGEAYVALGRHFRSHVDTTLLQSNQVSARLKSKVIEALSFDTRAETYAILLRHLTDENIRIAMAAWDFIRRMTNPRLLAAYASQDPALTDIPTRLVEAAQMTLDRNDMALTTLVASAIGDSSMFSIFRGTDLATVLLFELLDAYTRLHSPADTEALQAVIDALGKIGDSRIVPTLEAALYDPDRTVAVAAAVALARITGSDYLSRIPRSSVPQHTDYDWEVFEAISPTQRVVLETSKGTIHFQLFKDDAPFTVLSFVKLVHRGFYNGLTFHRVVPNFVVQGGDPRGDGWGGPGYAIRSEFSLLRYDRGMVGMASAGKDTEGCQFFVVHSPQPHLDGRYTVFARVIDGMEVVDLLQVGDTILSARLAD